MIRPEAEDEVVGVAEASEAHIGAVRPEAEDEEGGGIAPVAPKVGDNQDVVVVTEAGLIQIQRRQSNQGSHPRPSPAYPWPAPSMN